MSPTSKSKAWDKLSAEELIRNCKNFISTAYDDDGLLIFGKSADDLNKSLYFLVNGGVKGNIKKELVLNGISDIIAIRAETVPIILDVFNILDAETCTLDAMSDERMNLATIIKGCEKMFSEKLIKERLEIETLQEMKILNKGFQTKFIKLKTKLYYKQKKFNLFREECEGYSKLITEINQRRGSVTVNHILEVIKSLIGCFNLDPNRVLDVILDSFECHTDEADFYIPLLQNYMPQSKVLCEVLGFKYVYYQKSPEITPSSLYMVTALMLQRGVITFEDIYCWLIPDDKTIIANWRKEFFDNDIPYKHGSSTVVPMGRNDEEIYERKVEELKNIETGTRNQKFGLSEALIQIGEWKTFLKITKKLPSDFLMSYPPIAFALCELLHPLIDPIYKKCYSLGSKLRGSSVKPLNNSFAPKAAETLVELRDTVFPMLHILGPFLGCDAKLLYKIIRILQVAMAESNDDNLPNSLYYDVITLLDLSLLPTVSSLEYNCCVNEEIWGILRLYPYDIRYCLYGRWKNDVIKKYPHLATHNVYVQRKARDSIKKICKEQSKIFGRLLSKLTHFSPGSIFEYLLTQIVIYDNLIAPIVESFKYLAPMSGDILAYCITEYLATPGRSPTKYHDPNKDVTLSTWFVNISEFVCCIFKKYNVDLTGILQYICNQLKTEQSFDLIFLKGLVQKMAGIDITDEMTDEQLMALAGGDTLRAEAGYFNHVRNTKKSAMRLKESLLTHDLAFSLCLLTAQQRDCIIYKHTDNSMHLKLVGKLYDECQETFINYGTFLASQLSIEEYTSQLPDVFSLMKDYHLQTDVVFFLSRPLINHQITLKFDQLRKAESNYRKFPVNAKMQLYYDAANSVYEPLSQSIRVLYPMKIWDDMSPNFLFLFWSLSLYDIYVPNQMYTKEINKLKQAISKVPDNRELTSSKVKKEQERLNGIIDKLQDENKKQNEHVERILYILNQDKGTWFIPQSQKITKNETITQFLQYCLFPRCIFAMGDSLFCAKFIHKLHVIKTPNFSTLLCYDRLFCDIVYTVMLCTENEARRYGRFLSEILDTVMRWHSDKEIYDEECANFPGFVTKFRVSNQFCESNDHVGYENYRHVCHKWHYKITKSLVVCLESKDYIPTRNALIVLIKILHHFPVLSKLAQIIEKKVEKVRDEEKNKRADIHTMALSYCGLLKTKCANYIKEQDFHYVPQTSSADSKPVIKSESHNIPVINLIKEQTTVSKHKEGRPIEVISSGNVNGLSNKEKVSSKMGSTTEKRTKHKEESTDKEKLSRRLDRKESKEKRIKEEKFDDKYWEERHVSVISPKDEKIRIAVYNNSDDDFEDGTPNGLERESKKRKSDNGISGKLSKNRSVSASPDAGTKKEKRKTKKSERSPGSEEKKIRKRRGNETEASVDHKKHKGIKQSHENDDEQHNNMKSVVHLEKHHGDRDHEMRDKKYTFFQQ